MGTKLRHTESFYPLEVISLMISFQNARNRTCWFYLKGISKSELENIIDFLYNGETFVTQEELNSFLVTSQELKVKGLQIVDEETNTLESKPNLEAQEFTKLSPKDNESYLSPRQNKEFSNNDIILADDDVESNIANKNHDLDEKFGRMVERSQGLWKC